MKSKIAEAMELKYEPVAAILTDDKPDGAKQFKEGATGTCIMFMLAAAARGATAVFDRKTSGCPGGGVGLGFGNQFVNAPGGLECFCHFLSIGNENWEQGRKVAEQIKQFVPDHFFDDFVHGERYMKTPELVKNFIECLPITDIPYKYFVLKPLKDVDPDTERPEVVIFLTDMDQLAAMVVLANYGREGNENVMFPQAAGCHTLGIIPLREAKSDTPRAVVGMNDLSARVALKRIIKDDVMTVTVPFGMFEEMEADVPGSFLYRNTWRNLRNLKSTN